MKLILGTFGLAIQLFCNGVESFVVSAGGSAGPWLSSSRSRDLHRESRSRDLHRESLASYCTTCRMMAAGNTNSGNSKGTAKGFGKQPQTNAAPGESTDQDAEKDSQKKGSQKKGSGDRTLLLQFTCNRCEGVSQYMIGKVAYESGIVICTCKKCKARHLIADNLKKLDFPEFGDNIEEFMNSRGSPDEVKRARAPNFSPEVLEKYDLSVGDDGAVTLVPKAGS